MHHLHSRESFLPYLEGETDPDRAHDSKVNITMVGKKLGEALESKGIGVEVDTTDVVKMQNNRGLNYYSSYKVSREVVTSALATNKDLNYIFDINRDSQRKDVTTISIDGKSYARLFFIIGTDHHNYEKT
ncbi:stage II sporulation protein P [Bacillus sp. PS06]|nr:stage II sporulation protein P [Bacillus sp. PS06]MBD8071287.1 stage II sporulation protein P [Bacillus sp. PS06]